MSDVVLDLETFGLEPGSAIVSVAAVSLRGPDFYGVIANPSGVVNAQTVRWWFTQRAEVRDAIASGDDELTVLHAFSYWLSAQRAVDGRLRLWGSEDFDTAQLASLYRRRGLDVPWHYQEPRGLRTAFDLLAVDEEAYPWHDRIEHIALDCARQAALILRKNLGEP